MVDLLSQFVQMPCDGHFDYAKRVMQCVGNIVDQNIFYEVRILVWMEGYIDVG